MSQACVVPGGQLERVRVTIRLMVSEVPAHRWLAGPIVIVYVRLCPAETRRQRRLVPMVAKTQRKKRLDPHVSFKDSPHSPNFLPPQGTFVSHCCH